MLLEFLLLRRPPWKEGEDSESSVPAEWRSLSMFAELLNSKGISESNTLSESNEKVAPIVEASELLEAMDSLSSNLRAAFLRGLTVITTFSRESFMYIKGSCLLVLLMLSNANSVASSSKRRLKRPTPWYVSTEKILLRVSCRRMILLGFSLKMPVFESLYRVPTRSNFSLIGKISLFLIVKFSRYLFSEILLAGLRS